MISEPTYHTWSDATHTFATIRIWDELEFAYHDVVRYIPGHDASAELRALHSPLFLVLRIRYL